MSSNYYSNSSNNDGQTQQQQFDYSNYYQSMNYNPNNTTNTNLSNTTSSVSTTNIPSIQSNNSYDSSSQATNFLNNLISQQPTSSQISYQDYAVGENSNVNNNYVSGSTANTTRSSRGDENASSSSRQNYSNRRTNNSSNKSDSDYYYENNRDRGGDTRSNRDNYYDNNNNRRNNDSRSSSRDDTNNRRNNDYSKYNDDYSSSRSNYRDNNDKDNFDDYRNNRYNNNRNNNNSEDFESRRNNNNNDRYNNKPPSEKEYRGVVGTVPLIRERSQRPSPSSSVVIKGLHPEQTEEELRESIYQTTGKYPVNARVVKDRQTGEPRGFGFVDFEDIPSADKLLNSTQGLMMLKGNEVFLEYSRNQGPSLQNKFNNNQTQSNLSNNQIQNNNLNINNSTIGSDKQQMTPKYKDWICATCQAKNFGNRSLCFQCNSNRTDACEEVISEKGKSWENRREEKPTQELMIRNLSPFITEETLRNYFSVFGTVTSVKIVKDRETNKSKGFGFVEFPTPEIAKSAFQQCVASGSRLEGNEIQVKYARGSQAKNNPIANEAIQLAQWNSTYNSSTTSTTPTTTTTTANQTNQQTYNYYDTTSAATTASTTAAATNPQQSYDYSQYNSTPSTSVNTAILPGYNFDPASGFYYNAELGYYYDAQTGYYYDTSSGTYLHYDPNTKTYYASAANTATSAATTPTTTTTTASASASSTPVATQNTTVATNNVNSSQTEVAFLDYQPYYQQSANNKTSITTVGGVSSRKERQLNDNIQKWNQKSKELHQQPTQSNQQQQQYSQPIQSNQQQYTYQQLPNIKKNTTSSNTSSSTIGSDFVPNPTFEALKKIIDDGMDLKGQEGAKKPSQKKFKLWQKKKRR